MVWASSISEEAPQEEYQGLSWVKNPGNMWINSGGVEGITGDTVL